MKRLWVVRSTKYVAHHREMVSTSGFDKDIQKSHGQYFLPHFSDWSVEVCQHATEGYFARKWYKIRQQIFSVPSRDASKQRPLSDSTRQCFRTSEIEIRAAKAEVGPESQLGHLQLAINTL